METTTTSATKEKTLKFAGAKDAKEAAKAYIAETGEYTSKPKERELKLIANGAEKIKMATSPSDLLTYSTELYNTLSSSVRQFREIKDRRVPSLQSLSTFLGGLQGKWQLKIFPKSTSYWFEFQYVFPPFILEDKGLKVEFRNLGIMIKCYTSTPYMNVTMKGTKGKKTHLGRVSRIHPHHSSSFCLEGYEHPAELAGVKWDFISLFSIYDVAVHAYYRDRAFTPLDSFTNKQGWRCSSCGRWLDKRHKRNECNACRRCFCLACIKELKEENTRNKDCVGCKKEAGTQKNVSVLLCSSCLQARAKCHHCKICNKSICGVHQRRCFSCSSSYKYCPSCAPLTCPLCGSYSCKDHLSKKEEEKIAGICIYCSRSALPSRIVQEIEKTKKRLLEEEKKKINVPKEIKK